MAAAHLHDAFGPGYRQLDLPLWNAAGRTAWTVFDRLLEKPGLRTSSCGRLFDAISALAGMCVESSYEGEAAMLLEAVAATDHGHFYPYEIDDSTWPWTLDTRPLVRAIAQECTATRKKRIASAFHRTLGHMIEATCMRLRDKTGLRKVCLSGGTFQNFTLVADVLPRLSRAGFEVYTHALGQAAIASCASLTGAPLERN
jgi:hydrogenase maturation protein HypF